MGNEDRRQRGKMFTLVVVAEGIRKSVRAPFAYRNGCETLLIPATFYGTDDEILGYDDIGAPTR